MQTKNSNNSSLTHNQHKINQGLVKCRECGENPRYSVVKTPRGLLWLRCGLCDLALRRCPDPGQLSKSPNLTTEEREYCSKVAGLSWFGGSVAAVLLTLETKAGEGSNHG